MTGERSTTVDALKPAGPLDHVAGVPARFVASPGSTVEVAALLSHARQQGWTVVPRGAGTKLAWGNPPLRVDVLLDTTGLTEVVEHSAGDLVLRTSAGVPLSDLTEKLASAGQRLALTTRLPGQRGAVAGTVGGLIAANPSGPLRYAFGTVRDVLIGVTMVLADGTIAHSGGRVVKNVAGYDLGKLLIGSLGGLGVVTEAVFRLHPLPDASALITVDVDDGDRTGVALGRLATALRRSQLVPAAVEVTRTDDGPATCAVLVEGIAASVPARAEAAAALVREVHGGEADISAGTELPGWWWEPAAAPDGTALRIAVAPTGAGPLIDALADLGRTYCLTTVCRGALGAGVLHAGLSATAEADPIAALVEDLRIRAAEHDGTVFVEHAPRPVHAALATRGTDAYGPVPALDLMRAVKAQFDPGRLLAPGRGAGGI